MADSSIVAPIFALVGAFGGTGITAWVARRNLAAQQQHDRQLAEDRWKREAGERRRAELQRAYANLLTATGAVVPWSFTMRRTSDDEAAYAKVVVAATEALQVVMLVGSSEMAAAASEMVTRQNSALKLNHYSEELHGAYNRARDEVLRLARRELAEEPRLHAGQPLPPTLHY